VINIDVLSGLTPFTLPTKHKATNYKIGGIKMARPQFDVIGDNELKGLLEIYDTYCSGVLNRYKNISSFRKNPAINNLLIHYDIPAYGINDKILFEKLIETNRQLEIAGKNKTLQHLIAADLKKLQEDMNNILLKMSYRCCVNTYTKFSAEFEEEERKYDVNTEALEHIAYFLNNIESILEQNVTPVSALVPIAQFAEKSHLAFRAIQDGIHAPFTAFTPSWETAVSNCSKMAAQIEQEYKTIASSKRAVICARNIAAYVTAGTVFTVAVSSAVIIVAFPIVTQVAAFSIIPATIALFLAITYLLKRKENAINQKLRQSSSAYIATNPIQQYINSSCNFFHNVHTAKMSEEETQPNIQPLTLVPGTAS
jgi:hypothetical protein